MLFRSAAHDELANHLEITPALLPDGKMRETDAASLDNAVNGVLDAEINNPAGARPRASTCRFRYDRTNVFGTTKELVGTVTFQALGIAHEASLKAQLTTEIT